MPSPLTFADIAPAMAPRIGVDEWHCPGRQSSWAAEYQSHGAIELPLLGLDLRAIRGRQRVVGPGMVVLNAAAEEFHVATPTPTPTPTARPRRSTSLTFPHELLEDMAPDFAPGALRSSAGTAPMHQRLRQIQRGSSGRQHLLLDELARDELALMLVESVLADMRRQAAASRVFRRVTGQSIHRHLNQLRLRAALFRLPDMRGCLTEPALDSGFSSHSRFSSAFKAEFSCAPAAVR